LVGNDAAVSLAGICFMRILLTVTNYAPETTSVGPYNAGLAGFLASLGHQVIVITTFPYYPQWRIWPEYRGRIFSKESRNNVLVYRVLHFIPRTPSSVVQRLLHDFSFAFAACITALFAGPCDVIYCSAPPVAVGLTGAFLRRIKRARSVLKLTDISSDAALATGILKEGMLSRGARVLESFVYRHTDAIVCLCLGFVENLKMRGVDENKLRIISDWVDTEKIRPLDRDNEFRQGKQVPSDQFLILHAGNMGKKQQLINVLDAASLVRDRADIGWLLVGEGEERRPLEEEVAKRALSNLRFLPLQPSEYFAAMLSAADLLLLNQRAGVLDAVIPGKMLKYMAAGRPVLAAVHERSETARYIRIARCGVIVPPENPQALVDAIVQLKDNRPLCLELGANGRRFAEATFARDRVLEQYQAFFETIDGQVRAGTRFFGSLAQPDE